MVIIFRAVSGAGKSRLKELLLSTTFRFGEIEPVATPSVEYVRMLWNKIHPAGIKAVSADDLFIVNGEYKFDAKLLGTAHAACLRHFNELVTDGRSNIIVDNTNCTLSEFVPYAALANAYSHELQIITLVTDPVVAHQRNKHNVPFSAVYKQHLHLQQSISEMPPWFPQQIFNN